MTDQNKNYYLRRAEEELVAAQGASSPAISNIHREMAEHYRDILDRQSNRMGQGPAHAIEKDETKPRIVFG